MDPILAGPIAAGLVDGYTAYYRMSLSDMLDMCEILAGRVEAERREVERREMERWQRSPNRRF